MDGDTVSDTWIAFKYLGRAKEGGLSSAGAGKGVSNADPFPHAPIPAQSGRDQPELSYARLNGFGGKVTRMSLDLLSFVLSHYGFLALLTLFACLVWRQTYQKCPV